MKPLKPLKPLAPRKKTPRLQPQTSSHVEDHSYDPKTKALTIIFRGGRRYQYHGISQTLADGLAKADSKGSFLHSRIIGKFDVIKLSR